ncbi:MAG: 4-hydroxy-tetrahydrodipicolinate synthase [Bacteroidetes bacterium]|nr:4-hydroxy-tetrahydrodipicolinate synthase [Bacteroidota bacterium]
MDKFRGTGVAIVTPFKNDSSIDFRSLGRVVEHLINNNIDYLVVLGTTGESVTQSKDEKRAVIDHVIEINNGKVPVVIGMGGNCTREIVDSITQNQFDGIDGILSVAPYYNKPSQKGLYNHFKTIAGASPVPVIIYNVPGRTSINIDAGTTIRLANDVKNIVAVKEASGNIDQIMQIIKNAPPDFQIISGDDAIALPIISTGGSGVISVLANAYPGEWSKMVNYAINNNLRAAREIHYKFFDLISLLFADGNPAGIKAALSNIGLIQNQLRLPLTPVSRQVYNQIKQAVEEVSG